MVNKAVFLDRDGVINNDEGLYYIYKPGDLKLNEQIAENICSMKKAGYKVIVISNQGGIGKNLYKKEEADYIHNQIQSEVKKLGCEIDEFYYCPHHPDSGACLCRKPFSLMIEKALARFDIDKNKSYLVGDSKRDVEAAERAGVRGILVPKNTNIYSICKENQIF